MLTTCVSKLRTVQLARSVLLRSFLRFFAQVPHFVAPGIEVVTEHTAVGTMDGEAEEVSTHDR